jgi:hypothetical protein
MRGDQLIKFSKAYPRCFSDGQQYKDWKEFALRSGKPMYGVCTDCTPKFQAIMKEQRRCENPHVKFRPVGETGVEGYVSLKEEE